MMIRRASSVVVALVMNAAPLFGQSVVAPAAELTVKAAPANVHKSPTVASAVIGKAPAGTVLEIRRNLGSWVEVPWQGSDTGLAFLHVSAGTITQSTAVGSGTAQDAAAAGNNGSAVRGGTSAGTASRHDSYVALPPHHIGIGAMMNRVDASMPAFGATARTWWDSGLGVQFNLSRPRLETTDGPTMTSTQLASGVLYSLPDAVITAVWLRPYVGGGARFYRANLETRFGYEAFGGAEATLAAMPQFALSADVGYRWLRPSINGVEPRRVGFSLLAHWYVR